MRSYKKTFTKTVPIYGNGIGWNKKLSQRNGRMKLFIIKNKSTFNRNRCSYNLHLSKKYLEENKFRKMIKY